jgi:hypothetical protein
MARLVSSGAEPRGLRDTRTRAASSQGLGKVVGEGF